MSASSDPVPRLRRAQEEERRRIFPVRLSTSEREELDRLAGERGVSVGRLLVESALAVSLTAAERLRAIDELHRLNRLLANVAGNVNQIAYQANVAGQVLDGPALGSALEEIQKLRSEAALVLRQVG